MVPVLTVHTYNKVYITYLTLSPGQWAVPLCRARVATNGLGHDALPQTKFQFLATSEVWCWAGLCAPTVEVVTRLVAAPHNPFLFHTLLNESLRGGHPSPHKRTRR
jgi:hypothetical protein